LMLVLAMVLVAANYKSVLFYKDYQYSHEHIHKAIGYHLLANVTVRHPVRTTLDLGTGTLKIEGLEIRSGALELTGTAAGQKLLSTPLIAASDDLWLHVFVQEDGGDGETVRVNLRTNSSSG